MIVFKKTETGRGYSHIECDVPGCGAVSPPASDLLKKNLMERGWFIAGGQHRCPKHVENLVHNSGPIERAADGSEGFVR